MAGMTFDMMQPLIDKMPIAEQARLLAYLAPKLAGAVAAQEAPAPAKATTWDDFFAAGDALHDDTADQSMTAAVLSMRWDQPFDGSI